MDVEEVAAAMQMAGRHISMDAPFSQSDDGKNSLLDVLANTEQPNPDHSLNDESLKNDIERALSTLTEREAEVVKLYFGLNSEHPATLEEIGERLNLTRERVRQIKEKALQRLRHASRSKALKAYLG
jgi:RNA polymerase primary sigma factor